MLGGTTGLSASCTNCNQRKRQCDGEKPVCNPCIRSGLFCPGYETFSAGSAASSSFPSESSSLPPQLAKFALPMIRQALSKFASSPAWLSQGPYANVSAHPQPARHFSNSALCWDTPSLASTAHRRSVLSAVWLHIILAAQNRPLQRLLPSLPLDLRLMSNALPFILGQYLRLVNRMSFSSPPSLLQDGIRLRIETSDITYSSMLLGAKIIQALFDNFDHTNWSAYTHRIDNLRYLIDTAADQGSSVAELEGRIAGIMDLPILRFITADSASGYALVKSAAPALMRLAYSYPSVWTSRGKISLPRAMDLINSELSRFVWLDTISALVFGTVPLLSYDITNREQRPVQISSLEWIYGCPEEFAVLLGRINSWRSPIQNADDLPVSSPWQEIEAEVKRWMPSIDKSAESCDSVARLAIQECWRHALFIYLYMAMCGVNSADPRVESSVHQVMQLLGAVKDGSSIDRHLFVPCLIAGISARKEKQRALIRRRVASLSSTRIWVIRGADFTSVLDHLWHGAAKNGRPSTWDEYVRSRRTVLPVDE